MTAEAGTSPVVVLARAAELVRNAPQRLRERPFWVIQVGVLSVTALHLFGELLADEVVSGIHPALHHVPVILYLAPIAYASLRYGIEGALLTGLWCAVLTVPNIVVFHASDLEWLTELAYVAVVIGAGVTMAVPVERERRQRRRAEATSRRLSLLNEIATLTLTADLQHTLDEALDALVGVLGLDAACVATVDPDDGRILVPLARHPDDPAGRARLDTCLQRCPDDCAPGQVHTVDPGVMVVPFGTDLPNPGPAGRVSGMLVVQLDPARPLGSDDRQLLVGVGNQLATAVATTRLKDLERDRVRSYARAVTSAQEEERKRIARELHDEAAQNLVAIRRGLDALASLPGSGHRPATEVQALRDLTGETLAGLRRFSRDLRPPVLDDLGLASALESLVDDLDRRTGLVVDLAVQGAPSRLPATTELVLFRIAQAALRNVEQHADATRITVALSFEPDGIRLSISDDGRGVTLPDEITELAAGGKLGVLGMHERAHLVDAELDIDTAPGRGTCVTVAVPR